MVSCVFADGCAGSLWRVFASRSGNKPRGKATQRARTKRAKDGVGASRGLESITTDSIQYRMVQALHILYASLPAIKIRTEFPRRKCHSKKASGPLNPCHPFPVSKRDWCVGEPASPVDFASRWDSSWFWRVKWYLGLFFSIYS